MGTGLHFVGGEAVTHLEEALISATEINPASEADLKALTPKAQTPKHVLLGASASVVALASLTTGLCHTALQPKHVCFVLPYPVTQGQP